MADGVFVSTDRGHETLILTAGANEIVKSWIDGSMLLMVQMFSHTTTGSIVVALYPSQVVALIQLAAKIVNPGVLASIAAQQALSQKETT